MRKFKIMVSSMAALALVFGTFAITSNAAPVIKNAKERAAMAESSRPRIGLNPVFGTFTQIDNTGFEASDGFDLADAGTGFNGFICGPEFIDCTGALIDPSTATCFNLPGDNCCLDNPNPDNSWYISISSMHCQEPHIDNVHPASGEQHLRFTRAAGNADGHWGPDPGCVSFAGDCRSTAFSPDISGNGVEAVLPIGITTVSVDIASTGAFSSSFIGFWVADAASPSLFAYLFWDYRGGLYLYDYTAGFPYIANWSNTTPNYNNIGIVSNPCDGIVTYTVNGQVVFVVDDNTGPTGNALWDNRVLFMSDNAGEEWDVDNYSVERGPECPTTCGADGIEAGEDCEHTLLCFGGANNKDVCTIPEDCPEGDCLPGDTNCPGRCRAVGEEGECTCDRVNVNFCTAHELDNGTNSFLTDGGWYTFVADTTSTALDTCDTFGFDSYLVVFATGDGSNDCSLAGGVELGRQDDCGSHSRFGVGSDPLAACFDDCDDPDCAELASCRCYPTTIGQRYWVWNAGAGGVGGISVMNLSKRLTCEAEFTGGACCNDDDGSCTDVDAANQCTGRFQTFTETKVCESPSLSCVESVLGACCDRLNGFCTNTLRSDCTGSQPVWTPEPCSEITCDPDLGACCNTRFGTCTQETLAGCQGENLNWTKLSACNEQTCPDPFVPTVSEWGLVIMTLLLLIGAKVYFGRREALA